MYRYSDIRTRRDPLRRVGFYHRDLELLSCSACPGVVYQWVWITTDYNIELPILPIRAEDKPKFGRMIAIEPERRENLWGSYPSGLRTPLYKLSGSILMYSSTQTNNYLGIVPRNRQEAADAEMPGPARCSSKVGKER